MLWRLKRSGFEKGKGAGNKRAMKRIVDAGETPGLLAYAEGRPVAWCALAPRETYPLLENSRVLARVDDKPVWSVVCLFVERSHRRKGISGRLLRAAADYAAKHGARIVEGYPVEPKKGTIPDVFAWTGLPSAFAKAGFVEVARRSPTRPIMRRQTGRRSGSLP
jgi:GNAT superfamily N-acetyltransferase